jgi:hypothetical protein
MKPLGLDRYSNIVILTGAGVSVASGLRPYRGPADARVCASRANHGAGPAARHLRDTIRRIDTYVAEEAQATMRGMVVAVDPSVWQAFQTMLPAALGKELRRYAKHTCLDRFKKHLRGRKKPVTRRTMYTDQPHVSTARILMRARQLS